MTRWEDKRNSAKLPEGKYRSIAGYADESLVIGRALACGYNLFFKAWRDSSYDAVLDYNGKLFRIEIKGTRIEKVSTTSGGRSGQQISREAESREHIVSKNDCEFLICINGNNGDCYIIPTEVLEIFNQKSLAFTKVENFKEKWSIFSGTSTFDVKQIRDGFSHLSIEELENITSRNNISIPEGNDYPWQGFRGSKIKNISNENKLILSIWKSIFESID